MRVLIFLLLLVSFTSLKAQTYFRPFSWNFNLIELKILLKGSNGEDVVFCNHKNMVWFSSDKRFKLFSFEIDYRLANRKDMHFKCIKELERFFEQVYQNHPDDYIDRIKRILNVNRYGCFPMCKRGIYHYPFRGPEIGEVNECCFPADTIIYSYPASCNVNSEKTIGDNLIETPYFVPIRDVEIYFVQDDKTMHICFELYDYKKMGFSYRLLYMYNGASFEKCLLSLFMEIKFEEGDFVVTDESYPNLIKK